MAAQSLVPDVFHIGYQRTGTTWLQKGLFPLLADRIYVPESRQWIIYRATVPDDVAGIYDDIPQERVTGRLLIESEEGLCGGRFRDYLENARKISWVNPNARIMICIRSQFGMMPSYYYLYVRKGGTLSYPSYVRLLLENRRLDYWSLYGAYADAFGARNVRVFFQEDLATDPLAFTQDVLGWLGVEMPFEFPDQRYRNARAGSGYIAVLRTLNRLVDMEALWTEPWNRNIPEIVRRRRIRRTLFRPVNLFLDLAERVGAAGGGLVLSRALREAIDRNYGPGNRRLFAALGRTVTGSGYPEGETDFRATITSSGKANG